MIHRSSLKRMMAIGLLAGLHVVVASAQRPDLVGTWLLQKDASILSDELRRYQSSFGQSLTIDVVDDLVTVATTTVGIPIVGSLGISLAPEEWSWGPPLPPDSAPPGVSNRQFVQSQRFLVDGQPHEFPWGDTVPRSTGSRIVGWTAGSSGFEVVERLGVRQIIHRWSLSQLDGGVLTIESFDRGSRPDERLILVFKKQP